MGSLKKRYDDKGIEMLFKEHYGELCSFAQRYTKDYTIAEEIVQQFFVDFIYHKRYRYIETSLRKYLFNGVKYSVFTYMKKQRKLCCLDLIDDVKVEAQDNVIEQKNYKRELDVVLNVLPPKCKEVFVLVHIRNLSYQETADRLGISINTVKTHMKRAFSIVRSQVPSPF